MVRSRHRLRLLLFRGLAPKMRGTARRRHYVAILIGSLGAAALLPISSMNTVDARIADKLADARRELLDLSARNRLIHTPRKATRTSQVEIVGELAENVINRLVHEGKSMSFLGVPNRTSIQADVAAGKIEIADVDNAQDDDRLQTTMPADALESRLLKLFYDARTFEEEQGVGILYIAIGFLKWYESDSSDEVRYAPLLLVPVALARSSVRAKFRVNWTGDDITTNLSLQEKMRHEFSAKIPDIPDIEDLSPIEYFAAVRAAVSARQRWEVLDNDIVLGFFSFAKFLMYRDLQPENWPDERQIDKHGLMQPLLSDGFGEQPPIFGKNDRIDAVLPPADLTHVVDADSSQAMAIEEVRRGRNLVIQGPPGTGKSQTITNLIAAAAKQGQRVLFVAEKMAALEVVKRRLDDIGLGPMCLELHSHKSNKRAVVEELGKTLKLGEPKTDDTQRQASHLQRVRDALNRHAEIIHSRLEPSGITPYRLIGELIRLRSKGCPPVDFHIPEAKTWNVDALEDRRAALNDFRGHLEKIGLPRNHCWRGVQAEAFLVLDRDRLMTQLPQTLQRMQRLAAATEELGRQLECQQSATAVDSSRAAVFAQRLLTAPTMDRGSIADPVWHERRDDIDRLIRDGKALSECKARLREIVSEVAWCTDIAQARRDLAAHGRSWFRFFNGRYRAAVRTLQSVLLGEIPKTLQERLLILDGLLAGQAAAKSLQVGEEFGKRVFGAMWRGQESDWPALEKTCQWEAECRKANLPGNFRAIRARLGDDRTIAAAVKQIGADLKPMLQEVEAIVSALKLNLKCLFGNGDAKLIGMRRLHGHMLKWLDSPEALASWIAYNNRWRRLRSLGLTPLADQVDEGRINPTSLMDQFDMAYFEDLFRHVFHKLPELAEFDGESHEKLVEQFQLLDMERQYLARQEVVLSHYEGIPSGNSEVGELGVVRREINKRRRHIPLRQLLKDAGHAVQKIKPVFMMSPISVAQFLEPGGIEFDLLIIDEASQVRPVDALGAIARAHQIVVVGDDKQLPPTRFFAKVIADDEDDEDDVTQLRAGDIESVLGLCAAQGLKSRMLNWHYRSRHHSLIAVSNHEFYEDGLFVVPSPYSTAGEYGLRFRYLPQGVFDRGRSATNSVEAAAIADAVIEFAESNPKKSLGIGAFSVAQRDAILNELELHRKKRPDLEGFFNAGGPDPFFVKNLENIQGDERDVIFISVGYAKDDSGVLHMQFGPLSGEGGERRLNVLITRARERCEVFSSIIADDIDLRRTSARGAKALKAFLRFAQTGQIDVPTVSGKDHSSEFERQVAQAIRGLGWEVEIEVDQSGFFIDLAVVDPTQPGRYLLGIECDGAAYHSARWARDRDRLRQQVLENRGWMIHRVWSTDWFHKPQEQLRKVAAAIERAKAAWAQRDADWLSGQPAEKEADDEPPNILRYEAESEFQDPEPIPTKPYIEASFAIGITEEIHEISPSRLAHVVRRIVEIEGPIHEDEVAKRTATLWGLQRAGSRVRDAVEAALCEAKEQGTVVQEGLFFSPPKMDNVDIRNRQQVSSTSLKAVEFLPPRELCKAIVAVVESHVAVAADEIAVQVGRLLGFKATSAQLRSVIEEQIEVLVEGIQLTKRNERYSLCKDEPTRIRV